MPSAAYIHIPFCRRRCFYCDFPISVVGDRPPLTRQNSDQGFGTIAEYIDILCQEIQTAAAAALASPDISGTTSPQPLQTIFLGGGTPSLLTASQLAQVLQSLDRQFGIAPDAEISMEMDPDTFDRDRLAGYAAAGVNRVSLGAQAFQTELLQACGRTHTPEDIEMAVALLRQVGITNFSLDLISGLPHQTIEHWQASLQAILQLDPTHVSVYDLTVEAGTAFDRWYEAGVQPLPTEGVTVEMYQMAQQVLTQAGYQHYEVSNYAKPGYPCRHNRVYWENRSYYGFGMGAASYVNGQRFTRPRKRREYYDWVQNFVESKQIDWPITPLDEQLLDTLMLGLRLSEGVSLGQLAKTFGRTVVQQILFRLQPYAEKGWVEQLDRYYQPLAAWSIEVTLENRVHLTDPSGFLFSNVILADLFSGLSSDLLPRQ